MNAGAGRAGGGIPGAATQAEAERAGGGAWWLLMALPLFASAWVRELWAPDEPRYAEVAREMVASGSWWVMHRCGELYPDKPPMQFWLSGVSGSLGGWSELALRLPCLLATIGLAWLTAQFALRWFGRREAALAPAIFLSFALVTDIGGRLQIDPVFAFFCVAALYLLSEPLPVARGAARRCFLAGLCLAAALWTKGPPALVNTGLPLVLWLVLAHEREGALVRARGKGAVALVLGIAPVLLLAWISIGHEPALRSEWLYGQHVARVTETGQHWGPPGKPIWELPLWLLPWSAVVALGIALAWGAWRERARGFASASTPGLLCGGLWLGGLLLFYALIPPKRPLYLLPAYPAAAVLAAHALAQGERVRRLPRWAAITGPALLASLGTALLLAGVCSSSLGRQLGLEELAQRGDTGWRVALPGLALIAGGLWALWSWKRRALGAWTHAQLAGWAAGATAVALCLYPLVNPYKSSRELAQWVAGLPLEPAQVLCVGVQPEGYRFYGGFQAIGAFPGDLQPALEREGERFVALVRERDFEQLDPALRALLEVLHEDRVGSRRILVVGRSTP